MKTRLAASLTFALWITLGTAAWAQDNRTGAGKQGQETNQGRSDTQTIRGVVAGVTAEGEIVVDYKTNRAVLAEADYLTIVGSPTTGQGSASERRGGEQAGENQSGKKRENIYIVWLTPKTKVYEASDTSGGRARRRKRRWTGSRWATASRSSSRRARSRLAAPGPTRPLGCEVGTAAIGPTSATPMPSRSCHRSAARHNPTATAEGTDGAVANRGARGTPSRDGHP